MLVGNEGVEKKKESTKGSRVSGSAFIEQKGFSVLLGNFGA